MKLGTKTLLFGVHQIIIHPFLVTIAWLKLYRSFPTWREMFCILVHDWGYWGKPNLKDADGDKHPELGARIAGKLLGQEWNAEKKLKEAIKKLASEPESKKKGKWIFCGYNDYSGYTKSAWKCPVCKKLSYETSKFCPHCGVEMVVGK